MNNNIIQNWTEEQRQHLLNAILQQIHNVDYTGIYIVGSRVGGWYKLDGSSDIDVIVTTNNDNVDCVIHEWYGNVRLSGTCYNKHFNIDDEHLNVMIPKYDLVNNELLHVDAVGINKWLNFRITINALSGYDWTEGRLNEHNEFPHLIVDRIQQ